MLKITKYIFFAADESPPMKGTSPRNSSPVHENVGNLTNQLGNLELNESGTNLFSYL